MLVGTREHESVVGAFSLIIQVEWDKVDNDDCGFDLVTRTFVGSMDQGFSFDLGLHIGDRIVELEIEELSTWTPRNMTIKPLGRKMGREMYRCTIKPLGAK